MAEAPSDVEALPDPGPQSPLEASAEPSAGESSGGEPSAASRSAKPYDYLLKFLLVGDADVGKEEILHSDALKDPSYPTHSLSGAATLQRRSAQHATTTLFLDGKRVLLQLWSASGQGRFSTVLRSYSRGAHGIFIVYDITNKWSFLGLDRWLQEVEEHAPGLPKVLIGNRLHLAFNRRVSEANAQAYARKHSMVHFEVSSLCEYNVVEAFACLSRDVLARHGMGRVWGHRDVLTLSELCCRTIVENTTLYGLEHLTLPTKTKTYLKYYSMSHKAHARVETRQQDCKRGRSASMKLPRRPRQGTQSSSAALDPTPPSTTSSKKSCIIS